MDLVVPESFNLSRHLEVLDNGILDARHIEEPGYSAYGGSYPPFITLSISNHLHSRRTCSFKPSD